MLLTSGAAFSLLFLLWLSRTNSGFIAMGEPPSFLASNPDVLRAIWENGLLYTTFPTFLMAVYGSMWEGIVEAVAARQPFVELVRGARSEKTVLLDYKAENKVKAVYTALRLGHFLLAACMAASLLLSFGVVPMTAFLFTTQKSSLESRVAIAFTSELNHSLIISNFPYGPSIRTSLDWSAASLLMKAPPLPWTSGNVSYVKFNLLPSKTAVAADGVLLVNSTAYFARANCVALAEGADFTAKLLVQPVDGLDSVVVTVTGSDRGCDITGEDLLFDLHVPKLDHFKPISATTSTRFPCLDDGLSSRIIFLAGRYTGDRVSNHRVSNLTVVSCKPAYWAVPGRLNTTVLTDAPPRILGFAGDWPRATQIPGAEHAFFEAALLDPVYMEPGMKIRITNDFSRFVFDIASTTQPEFPLQPDLMANATAGMLERCYAGLAATVLSQPLEGPATTTAVAVTQQTRLVVVEPVAYFVLGCLTVVAFLAVAVWLVAAAQASALFEEPVGVLSVAGLAQRSAHLTADITELQAERRFAGRLRERALRFPRFMRANWKYSEEERHIFDTNRAADTRLTAPDRSMSYAGRYGTFS
ncbi:hypothetical protein B0T18DRAFT_431044 [Schizothecium vesticola]|uniref:Transmembrane protein n=1 Tax=Schizothecium vesticola TaxID=314040 RepID=A0AA40EQW2_9PEZI|nr:hypothetical protein B0T18DRAFT_431044 [Schizothecium vesticola]